MGGGTGTGPNEKMLFFDTSKLPPEQGKVVMAALIGKSDQFPKEVRDIASKDLSKRQLALVEIFTAVYRAKELSVEEKGRLIEAVLREA